MRSLAFSTLELYYLQSLFREQKRIRHCFETSKQQCLLLARNLPQQPASRTESRSQSIDQTQLHSANRQLFANNCEKTAEKESNLTSALKNNPPQLTITEPSPKSKKSFIVADSAQKPSAIVYTRARSAGRDSAENEPQGRLVRSYSLSDAQHQKSKSYLNSIEIYIITEHINKIEQKLAVNEQQRITMKIEHHKKLIQNHRKLSNEDELQIQNTAINDHIDSQQQQEYNTNSPQLMTQSTVYGLKRQLALLKGRLRKEERLLKQTNKSKDEDDI